MGKQGQQIYVEIPVRASLDRLWQLSQDPDLHPRWDLRFTAIRPVAPATAPGPPAPAAAEGSGQDGTQHFSYEFALPFHTIRGTGTSLGTRVSGSGHTTSVLKFATSDVLSPIKSGAGYWRYVPDDGGVRFITGYNYQPGWGALGKLLDARVIRPALGWATAVSFDRLRLWAENDTNPATARNAWLADGIARAIGIGLALLLFRAPAGTNTGVQLGVQPQRQPGSQGGIRSRPRRLSTVLPAATLIIAALACPAAKSVPRAARCSRSTTDRTVSRAPSALADLQEPA